MPLLMFVTRGETTCDLCLSYEGKIYSPDQAPHLPIHEHCDCELVPIPTHEHPEINARLDAIEARLNAISLTITGINDTIRPRGAADQVAYFEDADHVIGSPFLTFDGADQLNAQAGSLIIASGGHTCIELDDDVDVPQAAFFGAVEPISRPIATDLPTALTALQNLGLIAAPAGPAKLVISPYSATGGLTQNGLNWSWVWGSGAGIGVWAVQGIPVVENGRMNMSFSIDTRGGNPTGPNWSRGAWRIQAAGEAGDQAPNCMGSYYATGTVDTIGVRNIANTAVYYAPSATMYLVLRVWRTAPVLAGSYITGHLISFSWYNQAQEVLAEYP